VSAADHSYLADIVAAAVAGGHSALLVAPPEGDTLGDSQKCDALSYYYD
jgi:glycerate-2-kinase